MITCDFWSIFYRVMTLALHKHSYFFVLFFFSFFLSLFISATVVKSYSSFLRYLWQLPESDRLFHHHTVHSFCLHSLMRSAPLAFSHWPLLLVCCVVIFVWFIIFNISNIFCFSSNVFFMFVHFHLVKQIIFTIFACQMH